jgi:pyruvate/oxaloacetate carboxyltransferase
MNLTPPLSNLIGRCQTICESECCGIDAYDFSPIQIASYLTMYTGGVEEPEIEKIKTQLNELSKVTKEKSITIEDMNQIFSPSDLNSLIDEINQNLTVAINLIELSESQRTERQIKAG